MRLSVSNVESLSLEIGVTSFYAQTPLCETVDGVDGAVRITPFTPIGTVAAAAASSSQSRGGDRK